MKKLIISLLLLIPTLLQAQVITGSFTGVSGTGAGGCTATVKESQISVYDDFSFAGSSATKCGATQFTATGTYTLTRISTLLSKYNSIGADILTAYLYSDSTGAPGTALATATNTLAYNDMSVYPTRTWQDFNFAGYSLTPGTYWLVICSDGTTGDKYWGRLGTGTDYGATSANPPVTWTNKCSSPNCGSTYKLWDCE